MHVLLLLPTFFDAYLQPGPTFFNISTSPLSACGWFRSIYLKAVPEFGLFFISQPTVFLHIHFPSRTSTFPMFSVC